MNVISFDRNSLQSFYKQSIDWPVELMMRFHIDDINGNISFQQRHIKQADVICHKKIGFIGIELLITFALHFDEHEFEQQFHQKSDEIIQFSDIKEVAEKNNESAKQS